MIINIIIMIIDIIIININFNISTRHILFYNIPHSTEILPAHIYIYIYIAWGHLALPGLQTN